MRIFVKVSFQPPVLLSQPGHLGLQVSILCSQLCEQLYYMVEIAIHLCSLSEEFSRKFNRGESSLVAAEVLDSRGGDPIGELTGQEDYQDDQGFEGHQDNLKGNLSGDGANHFGGLPHLDGYITNRLKLGGDPLPAAFLEILNAGDLADGVHNAADSLEKSENLSGDFVTVDQAFENGD